LPPTPVLDLALFAHRREVGAYVRVGAYASFKRQRVVFKWIFAPTGKVGAYASVGFGFSHAYARVGAYRSYKKLPSGL
jgi:hypothetical protein